MQKKLPKEVGYENIFAKYQSKGLLKRIFIIIQSAFNQGDINHITGDIHFVALFLRKKKTILTVHDIGSVLKGGGIKTRVLRFFWFVMPFARVKYVTVISEFTKNEILKEFKINPKQIIVIPDCVSTDIKYSEKEFNTEKPNILQIGTKPNKNKLTDEQKQLLIKYKIDYENRFNIDYFEIVEAYKNTDIVTFISTYEGFGVPILEAQATGRVVITSNLSPMTEVSGEGAVFVNPRNISEINSTIKKIISDEALRKMIIVKGKENVSHYSAKSIASQYYELYKKI